VVLVILNPLRVMVVVLLMVLIVLLWRRLCGQGRVVEVRAPGVSPLQLVNMLQAVVEPLDLARTADSVLFLPVAALYHYGA
jgi:hypothetical protein